MKTEQNYLFHASPVDIQGDFLDLEKSKLYWNDETESNEKLIYLTPYFGVALAHITGRIVNKPLMVDNVYIFDDINDKSMGYMYKTEIPDDFEWAPSKWHGISRHNVKITEKYVLTPDVLAKLNTDKFHFRVMKKKKLFGLAIKDLEKKIDRVVQRTPNAEQMNRKIQKLLDRHTIEL